MQRVLRCPFCIAVLPRRGFMDSLVGLVRSSQKCPRCGRAFSRSMADQVAHVYDQILQDFENRLAAELKTMPICDRAEVLVQFGLRMEDAQVASAQMLLRALAQTLEPQLAGLSRGFEGRLGINRVEKGKLAVVDIDAFVEDGKHSRKRLRIARIDSAGFIQVDRDRSDTIVTKQIAR